MSNIIVIYEHTHVFYQNGKIVTPQNIWQQHFIRTSFSAQRAI